MGIQFEMRWALLLLLPLVIYVWWMWISVRRLQGMRKQFVTAVRSIALLLLVLAVAGTQWYTLENRKSIVFAVDRSDSVGTESKEAQWIRDAAKTKSDKDESGVVSIGLDAALEKPLDNRGLDGFQLTSQTNPEFTDIASGLQLASSMLPAGGGEHIILLSDGEENVGDMLRQGKLLRDRGIAVDVVPLLPKEKKDAAIEAVRVPDQLYQAESYTVEVQIKATAAGMGELRVYEDDQEITAQQVQLEKGDNRFAVRSLAKEPGFHRYRAEIYMNGDEQSANNTHYAFSKVQGPPKVLIVEGKSGASKNVEAALQSALIPFDTIAPELLSNDFVTYTGYESIVLNNVSATQIPETKMEMIEQAVRDYGVGLVMLGGEDSYGLGGYFKTPIERALPVYMDLRGKREIPSLGIVLVMDKSGSMEGEKIKLAQEAASRTVDLLRDKDTLGVIGFDSSPVWYVEPQKLSDKDSVIRQINSIPADGGTEIYTAVQEAYSKLAKVDAQRKHIILLTDGQSATNQSYEQLAANMKKDGITMSTVAIGQDADQSLLKQLADLAEGRYYAAVDQTTIPAIFSREAVLISRTYIVNQPFVPAFSGAADWSGLFGGGVPALNGYIATTPKETAEVVLSSAEPDPILARWQYGSGRSIAWTSDVTGAWSADWVAWPDFPKVLLQMIKWTFPQFQSTPLELNAHLSGSQVQLEARSGAADFQGELRAIVTDEALGTQDIHFTPTAPGEYSAEVSVDKSGVYIAKTELLEAGGEGTEKRVIGSATSGFVIPYSPEYRITEGKGLDKLKQLADLTGGRVLSLEHPEEAFAFASAAQKRLSPISPYLLAAALVLLLLDIAARRISLPPGLLAMAAAKLARARPAGPRPQAETPLARLQQRKQLAEHKLQRTSAPASPAPQDLRQPPGGAGITERPSSAAPQTGAAALGDARALPNQPRQSAAGAPSAASAARPGMIPPAAEGRAQAPRPAEPAGPAAAAEAAPPDSMSRLLAAKRRGRK